MKYFVFLLSLIVINCSFGQDNMKVDEKAAAILQEVSEKYDTYKTIKADFEMIFDFPESDDDEVQNGTVYLKGDAYKLNLEGHTIITDNRTLWTFLEEVNEVQISYYEPDETTITPSQIFNIYEEDFYFVYVGDKKLDNQSFYTIDLTPNDKDKPYFKIRIWINKEENTITKAVVFDKNANKYIYKIKNFEANVKLTENFFSFDTSNYPDVEVIDLR